MKRRILGPSVSSGQSTASPVVTQQTAAIQAPPVMPPAPPVAMQAPPPPAMPSIQQQIEQAVIPAPPVQIASPVQQAPPFAAPLPRLVNSSLGDSPLHSLDMGTEDVGNFRQIPADVWIEAEITKTELKTSSNGNPMIALQLKATWPNEYVGCVIWDQVVITQAAAWKYKSICAACVDEEGNRLLSEDNRRFTGTDEQDFVGNVVRFKSDEATVSANGSIFNKIKGGYQSAFETDFSDDTYEEIISSDNGNVPAGINLGG